MECGWRRVHLPCRRWSWPSRPLRSVRGHHHLPHRRRAPAGLPPHRGHPLTAHRRPSVGVPDLALHLVGGRLRHRTRATVDAWALRSYGEINADVVFVAANGFSTKGGLTTPDLAEAAVKRAMMTAARRVVLVADSAKYGQEQFAHFGELSDVDLLITDTGMDAEDARAIERAGTAVVRA